MTNYTNWKNWDAEEFGLTSKENSLYYKKIFSKYLPDTKNVLEIGYGNGSFLNWCKQKHLNVSGIEQDNDLLKRAKNKGYKVYKSIAQIKEVKFDLIVLNGRLSKFPTRLIRRVLHVTIEKIIRYVFSPLPRGILSANLLCILSHNEPNKKL